MRIAIDGRALTGRFTGDRTYWRGLLHALSALDRENEYTVYHRMPLPPGEAPLAPNVRTQWIMAKNDRVWTLLTLPLALRKDRMDLVHVQYTAPPGGLCPCPIVTTVHDISFRLFPEWFPVRHRFLLNATVPSSMRRAARVITDSESSRKDILAAYPWLAAEKVVATPLGLPHDMLAQRPLGLAEQETAVRIAKERYGLEAPFILALGVLQPRKNLTLLAEAFGRACRLFGLEGGLALAGKPGWGGGPEALQLAAEREGGVSAADRIHFPGYVADEDVPILYRACHLFAHPALYEGFGLPPLEAMACGAPTVVSDAPAMPEVVGDAAVIVPARDVQAWSETLASVSQNAAMRADLSLRGPLRAARFTWEETARRTLMVYRDAASNRARETSSL